MKGIARAVSIALDHGRSRWSIEKIETDPFATATNRRRLLRGAAALVAIGAVRELGTGTPAAVRATRRTAAERRMSDELATIGAVRRAGFLPPDHSRDAGAGDGRGGALAPQRNRGSAGKRGRGPGARRPEPPGIRSNGSGRARGWRGVPHRRSLEQHRRTEPILWQSAGPGTSRPDLQRPRSGSLDSRRGLRLLPPSGAVWPKRPDCGDGSWPTAGGAEAQSLHNDLVARQLAVARRAGSLSHEAYVRWAPPGTSVPDEWLAIDVWMDAAAMNDYYAAPEFIDAAEELFAAPPSLSAWVHPPGDWVEW